MKSIILFIIFISFTNTLFATELNFTSDELKKKWRKRILFLLDKKKLPKIDMEASITVSQIEKFFPEVLKTYDKLGIALSSFDGYQNPKDGSKGYRWSNYILDLSNKYPEYIIPTSNGGTSKNWTKAKKGKNSFIDQLESEIQTGKYFNMGELEFTHYMSSKQCEKKSRHRHIHLSLDSSNSKRVFALSEKYNIPFVIHLEPEDHNIDELDKMLKIFPNAKVIWAHFGQLRQPELQKDFNPTIVKKILTNHPNLYFDLATGHPNRKYKCSGKNNNETLIGDTIIWEGKKGKQKNKIKKKWQEVLIEFSDRFVFATDYGGGRKPLDEYLTKKVNNFNDIIKDLPNDVKHNIAYKNAWYLLTGNKWK
tara:strand:+ start:686 stop:1780 length:1095 start_codon:yes stop_codon:yes gene_type:complete